MASRTLYPKRSLGRELVDVAFSFPTNGASNPASIEGRGVASVTRTGTGAYLVTFQDAYAALVAAQAMLQLASAGNSFVQVGAYTAASKTLVLTTLTAGAAADIAAAANNRVHVHLTFRNSVVA